MTNFWNQFFRHRLGVLGLVVLCLFILVGVYAPFLASSKPLFVEYDGEWYYPLFRYLFFRGFFTKRLDLFFNILIFTLPVFLITIFSLKRWRNPVLIILTMFQFGLFTFFAFGPPDDPASEPVLNHKKQIVIQNAIKSGNRLDVASWEFELSFMNDYEKLNELVRYKVLKEQNEEIVREVGQEDLPTLFQIEKRNQEKIVSQLKESLKASPDQPLKQARLDYFINKQQWLETQSRKLHHMVMPLIRPFHWQDDAGGSQALNRKVDWWQLTRINRKDLTAALIFGVRISLVVGIISVSIALLIGVPLGSVAGYYGGRIDILLSRLLEVWESMPVFFMLLLVVAILQTKSIFIVMTVIGIFGWTGFSRYIRGEFFKQRNLPYVEACHAQGFPDRYIIMKHILPNAIPPLLTLLPFAIMGAITSEAGLSFLGLGEEGSCSWGVLMDEGRKAFPGESYLLWPPAILLTLLLISIALMGDALRDALDPKMHVETS
ncbi:MAG: Inner membrane ABC transporter permease protein YejE [Chlamydiae bacterium]|nr:Inner membrane ABC transporter permease protein YejE [Chlamydiota bacterium]